LEAIGSTGSISAAGARSACPIAGQWLLVHQINQGVKAPAVTAAPGGRGGGRAIVTPTGEHIINLCHAIGPQARVYAPSTPDLGGVRVAAGDYVESQLAERMDRAKLIADIVGSWSLASEGCRKHGGHTVWAMTSRNGQPWLDRRPAASTTRFAHAGNTTELMAISGHKTLSQVELYAKQADRKRLANAGMATRLRGAQNENADVANLDAANYLKLLKLKNAMRFHQGSEEPILEQPL
jgi:molybdate transport repressor ModE-like protein